MMKTGLHTYLAQRVSRIIIKSFYGICTFAAAALLLSPSIATAQTKVVSFIVTGSSFALDNPGGGRSPGTGMILFQANGGANQKWALLPTRDNDNSFFISNTASGLALDVAGSSTADGAQVIQFGFQGGDNQKWFFTDIHTGADVPLIENSRFRIFNKHSGKPLALQAGRVIQGAITGNDVIVWRFQLQ